ncbi:hypothetical protein JXA02_12590, partial [candidate division KSB1 bacterium]|nr:hypothetical protein [candidate division KSB1 bacterium]
VPHGMCPSRDVSGREMFTDTRPSGINIPLYCPPRTDVLGDRAMMIVDDHTYCHSSATLGVPGG